MSCDAVLIPTTTILKTRENLSLHFLSIINKESFDEMKTSANLAGSNEYIDYFHGISNTFDFSGNYDDFKQARDKYFQQIGFDKNFEKSIDLIETGLPPHVTQAWVKCKEIHKKEGPGGFSLRCSYYDETKAIIICEYLRNPNFGLPMSLTIVDSTIEGGIGMVGAKKGELFKREMKVSPGSKRYKISRINKQPLLITTNIQIGPDTTTQQLEIPLPEVFIKPRKEFLITLVSYAGNATVEITNRSGKFSSSTFPARLTEIQPNHNFSGPEAITLKLPPGSPKVTFSLLFNHNPKQCRFYEGSDRSSRDLTLEICDRQGNTLVEPYPLDFIDQTIGINKTV
jgi:hypothetical protein